MESYPSEPTSAPAPGSLAASGSNPSAWSAAELAPHEPALRACLHGIARPPDIDDLVQETYARILRAREQGPVLHPRGLLFATARNAARDLFRRRAVANAIPIAEMDESRVFDEAPGVAETISRRQEADLLTAAIADLPPRCREILVLRKFENLSHREIAQKRDIAAHPAGGAGGEHRGIRDQTRP